MPRSVIIPTGRWASSTTTSAPMFRLAKSSRASLTVWSGPMVATAPPLLARTFAMFTSPILLHLPS